MNTALSLLLAIALQDDESRAAHGSLSEIAGLSTLEIILVSACGTLAATIGIVWKWGNDIRRENAAKFDSMGKDQTKLIVDQTADNKDVVHALTDMSKTLDRLAQTSDSAPALAEIKSMIQRLLDK